MRSPRSTCIVTLRAASDTRVHACSDPALIELIAKHDVVLEVCPTSNILTGAFDDIDSHPLAFLLRQGVKRTINTDDPCLFGIDWNFEYEVARSQIRPTQQEIDLRNEYALDARFLPQAQRPS